MAREIPLPHPGIVLKEEFLEPMGISVYAAAKATGIARSQLNRVCHGGLNITAPMALRLGKYLNVDPKWFMNMQVTFDLVSSSESLTRELQAIDPVRSAA
ncbi:HigA family addiction module antitoxin [Rhizobium sp. BE258]|jgi:addiction module HigA family antidote|uniref:HigA family addiction module antitoxin n=1 Tax=unclassified Rhizobium TaxID=2613769 RepID=UPI000DD6970B|nr:HigA family addiction module antitoxin [Rhizobium sp. BE258]MDR7142994.1 addiction module HigA family antidote [Rhizobium sp. BE258]